MKRITVPEFHALLKAQDVPTREDLAFKCPRCGTIQSMGDLLDTGMDKIQAEKYLGFSCVGRFTNAGSATKEGTPAPGKVGCDWTLGGLFHLHNLEVTDKAGKVHPMFDICEPEEAKAHALARAERVTAAREVSA